VERPDRKAYDVVRDYWREKLGPDFEAAWRRALHDGLVPDTAAPERSASVTLGSWALEVAEQSDAGLELVLRVDPRVHDGRFANNGWLQELPDPITKITWDNAAIVSPATAAALGIPAPVQTSRGHQTPLARLALGDRAAVVPVWIQPGQPDGVVGLSLGYGRRRAGRVGTGVGVDAARFRTSAAPWYSEGARLEPLGETRLVACTQDHWTIEQEEVVHERHLVRSTSLADYREHPERIGERGHTPDAGLSFYPPHPYEGHAWGMAVDMSACVGCNACVVACQAENNIPVVGRDEVGRGREMQWIRIDRYYQGGLENPEAFNQPLMCQHCENAPCEVVCPVAATVHSDEGLNDMVYNRCVGTRYCSNNCPYKVRRFNFFLYQDWETPSLKLQRNPDVTVRSRGVMEKCSYCVQRINQARIEAKNEGRAIRDGDIQTACQQSCPAEAIVFGDINDPESAVSRLKAEPRSYGLLADTGTRPRTSYLAAIRNPNPELAGEGEAHG
jgi:molybdopterin-containing oxidoreductase family iron-sulfur binding subunit